MSATPSSAASGTPADAPNPGLVFDAFNAYQRTAALRGAIELDLFTGIALGHHTAPTLAAHCGADPRGMRILCDYLVVHGFLTKSADQYGLTPTAAVFLDQRSPQYMGSVARFLNSPHLLEAFDDVAQLVRHGGTLLEDQGTTATDYEGWVEFARCMVPLMHPAAQFLGDLAAARKPGPIKVLDIAAGHGMFGILVAQKNPQAQIVALDWEKVLTVATENAVKLGVQDRHTLLPGDALKIDYGTGYDLVLLTNFLHHFNAETCELVMKKIHAALKPGGMVLTLEFVPNEDRVSPPMPATFSFTMLGTTPAGDAYTFAEYDALWKKVGLAKSEMLEVPNSAQRVIISTK